MPIFYRGAGPGTFWALNDARHIGFTSRAPGLPTSSDRLIQHIARGTTNSPYISLSKSFPVARYYALSGLSVIRATPLNPGFVYEIELTDPLPVGLIVLDPIREIANNSPGPLEKNSYHHDGEQTFLLGVIDPDRMKRYLTKNTIQAPPAGGTPRPPNLTGELEAMVRSLRDSEILAIGNIPKSAIVQRHEVH